MAKLVELFFKGTVFSVSVKAVKPFRGGVDAVEQKTAEETVLGILDEGFDLLGSVGKDCC